MIELKWKCTQQRNSLENKDWFHKIEPLSPISAIITRIQQLASRDKFKSLENDIKDEYREIFEPIPHADLLPTDYARIKLKQA